MYRKKKGKELQLQIADCNTFPLNSTAKFSSVQEQVLTELFKSLRYSLIKITRFVTEMHKRKEQTLNLPIFNVYSFASDPMQNCSFGHSPKQQLQHWDFCPWGEAHSKVRCRRKVGGVHSSARNPRCRHTGVWRHRYLLGTRSCLGSRPGALLWVSVSLSARVSRGSSSLKTPFPSKKQPSEEVSSRAQHKLGSKRWSRSCQCLAPRSGKQQLMHMLLPPCLCDQSPVLQNIPYSVK